MKKAFKRDVVNELHKPARVNFPRRRVIVKGLNDLYQCDLVEMIPYSKVNKGYKYILMIINVFSKYVWSYPLKNKSSAEIVRTFKHFLSKIKHPPQNLQTDFGKEFYNKDFKELLKKYNINHYSSYSNLKASVVERVNRTIKNLMYKEFSMQGNYKWLGILPTIISKYNNTKHRTTGYKPCDVDEHNEKSILQKAYTHLKIIDVKKPKFKIGDKVRVSKHRSVFKKGYTPSWSNEIFTVIKIQTTNPRTFIIQDYLGEIIKGGFYAFELQKVKHSNIYLIEKILRRKGNQIYVKWLNMDKKHNSWINAKDIKKL